MDNSSNSFEADPQLLLMQSIVLAATVEAQELNKK